MSIKVFTQARITVATAGTRQQVTATPTDVTTAVFTADPANTGIIYVGDDAVSATRSALVLQKGQAGAISDDESGRAGGEEFVLSDFYVDASVSGDKVYVSYIKRR